MATRVKARPDLHTEDLYAWSKTQADLLRAGRLADLDLGHLIEEIDDVGGALKRAVRNRTRTILEHLLKLQHSPAREPRGLACPQTAYVAGPCVMTLVCSFFSLMQLDTKVFFHAYYTFAGYRPPSLFCGIKGIANVSLDDS